MLDVLGDLPDLLIREVIGEGGHPARSFPHRALDPYPARLQLVEIGPYGSRRAGVGKRVAARARRLGDGGEDRPAGVVAPVRRVVPAVAAATGEHEESASDRECALGTVAGQVTTNFTAGSRQPLCAYPDSFSWRSSGCVLPAESVAREASVYWPGVASKAYVKRRQAAAPSDGP